MRGALFERITPELLERHNTRAADTLVICSGAVVDRDDTCMCGSCDEHSLSVDTTTVRVSRRREEEYCEACRDDHAFRCADCRDWFHGDLASGRNTSDGSVCDGCSESYFLCEACSSVCSNEDHGEDGNCRSCSESDDDSDVIPGYHDTKRNYQPGKRLVFGAELELLANDEDDCLIIYETAKAAGFIGERDGSLDDKKGIEIVGPPDEWTKTQAEWESLLQSIKGKAKGWNAGEGYGMHVSINRLALTQFHQGKLLVFVNGNKELCERIAGRKESTWAKYVPKRLNAGKVEEGQKYEALACRSHSRLEMRIFRSTLLIDGFKRNLQFAAASVEFTRDCSITDLTEDSFLVWLKQPEIAGQYPQLWAHLFTTESERRQAKLATKGQLKLKIS